MTHITTTKHSDGEVSAFSVKPSFSPVVCLSKQERVGKDAMKLPFEDFPSTEYG